MPGPPLLLAVPPTLVDHVPRLRRQLVRHLGPDGTDLLFGLLNATTAALTVAPTAAAAEAATPAILVEAWDARLAWRRHEPGLAGHVWPDDPVSSRPSIRPTRPMAPGNGTATGSG